jgi:hypothetical protein
LLRHNALHSLINGLLLAVNGLLGAVELLQLMQGGMLQALDNAGSYRWGTPWGS